MPDKNEQGTNNLTVPYLTHESNMNRMENIIIRIATALIAVCILWFATIGIFLWYLNQYDYSETTYTQDGRGINIIGSENGVDLNVTDVEDTATD